MENEALGALVLALSVALNIASGMFFWHVKKRLRAFGEQQVARAETEYRRGKLYAFSYMQSVGEVGAREMQKDRGPAAEGAAIVYGSITKMAQSEIERLEKEDR